MQKLTHRAVVLANDQVSAMGRVVPTLIFRNIEGKHGLFGFENMPPIPMARRGLVQHAAYSVQAVETAFVSETWLVERDVLPLEAYESAGGDQQENLSRRPDANDVVTIFFHSMLTDKVEVYIAFFNYDAMGRRKLGPFEEVDNPKGEMLALFDKVYPSN